ncbi:MAG: hypothetical protein DMF41_04300 [Verrucomicrobia bacterium]|nr:MAG: hypothetical protein DMF41_04300 [Verrucomicrobiota bacterium]
MGQFETAICLSLELIKHRMISNHQVGKKFQRDIALQFFIACEPDNPHPASPEDLDQRVAAKDFLSAAELTRRRFRDAARVLVSHIGTISIIKVERKVKAERRVRGASSHSHCLEEAGLDGIHFAPTVTFW